ncbi:unnamed protein product, partial [Durusdinium trenchii]
GQAPPLGCHADAHRAALLPRRSARADQQPPPGLGLRSPARAAASAAEQLIAVAPCWPSAGFADDVNVESKARLRHVERPRRGRGAQLPIFRACGIAQGQFGRWQRRASSHGIPQIHSGGSRGSGRSAAGSRAGPIAYLRSNVQVTRGSQLNSLI